MKKILSSLVIVILLLSGCGFYNISKFVAPDDLAFTILIMELDTPKKISDYMIENFKYVKGNYITKNPYKLYLEKEGDCKDFLCFGSYMAHANGYEVYKIIIQWRSLFNLHVICIYKEDIYSFTDNQYYYYGFNNFREMVEKSKYINRLEWESYKVYDYNGNLIEKGEK